MASFERVVTTFTRGELSPRISGRIDFEGRFDGARELTNFLVQVQGGATKRPGTRFVNATKDETDSARLIPFEFSIEQTYVIEATDLAFRFYADEALLLDGASNPVEVTTPYTASDLARLKWTQSADILFLAHPDHEPRELRRTSPTDFNMVEYGFRDGPYLDLNTTDTTMALSGTTGSVTVTLSSVEGLNDDGGFNLTDVGRLIRWKDPAGNWTWLEITAVASDLSATATIRGADASAGTATTNWRMGAWSDTTGWPSVTTFHEGRLWWGRTASQPQTIWSTVTGDFRNFAPSDPDGTVTDDAAITVTIDSNRVNAIAWLQSTQRGLLIGTIGEEWVLQSSSDATGLTPTSAQRIAQSSWGSDDTILPVRIGTSTIFVQRGSTYIREAAFSFDEDVFTASNISTLSEHLFRQGVRRLAFQQVPTQTLWALLEDDTIAGFTFDKEQEVIAWHHHEIGGTDVEVLDIAASYTIHAGVDHHHLWMVVRRTIDGAQHQYVEFIEAPFNATLHDIEDAFFVDSGLTGTFGTPQTVISGLDHLEGEEVAILADGATHPNKVVGAQNPGEITLDRPASVVHVGLPYTAAIETLPLEASPREGPFVSPGKTKRIHQAHVLLAETVGLHVGPAGGDLDEIAFRDPSMLMDQPVPLFDGFKPVSLSGRHEQSATIRAESRQPLPATVLSIAIESEVHGS